MNTHKPSWLMAVSLAALMAAIFTGQSASAAAAKIPPQPHRQHQHMSPHATQKPKPKPKAHAAVASIQDSDIEDCLQPQQPNQDQNNYPRQPTQPPQYQPRQQMPCTCACPGMPANQNQNLWHRPQQSQPSSMDIGETKKKRPWYKISYPPEAASALSSVQVSTAKAAIKPKPVPKAHRKNTSLPLMQTTAVEAQQNLTGGDTFDTGWVAVQSNGVYMFNHNFGSIPTYVNVYECGRLDRQGNCVGDVVIGGQHGLQNGNMQTNPVQITSNSTTLKVALGSGWAWGYWTPGAGWQCPNDEDNNCNTAYYRIIAIK